jgi:hypothetical protein
MNNQVRNQSDRHRKPHVSQTIQYRVLERVHGQSILFMARIPNIRNDAFVDSPYKKQFSANGSILILITITHSPQASQAKGQRNMPSPPEATRLDCSAIDRTPD